MNREKIESIATALVVGGGIGGMAAAISLARRGVAVELIDLDPDWRVYGAGITITGPTLRAYAELGLIDRIVKEPVGGAQRGRAETVEAVGKAIEAMLKELSGKKPEALVRDRREKFLSMGAKGLAA